MSLQCVVVVWVMGQHRVLTGREPYSEAAHAKAKASFFEKKT
jgi:hypothetical protein